jgi:hypothetical protein
LLALLSGAGFIRLIGTSDAPALDGVGSGVIHDIHQASFAGVFGLNHRGHVHVVQRLAAFLSVGNGPPGGVQV